MTEELLAREVHALLISATADSDEKDFRSAAELASLSIEAEARWPDDFRAAAIAAIEEIQKAVVEGASYFERRRLLHSAVISAHSWLNARRFMNQK